MKPAGRTLAEFGTLWPAEAKLRECARIGQRCRISGSRPDAAKPGTPDDLDVRATFLRFLLLGGDDSAPVHEFGVQLEGARVVADGQGSATIDLHGCRDVRLFSLLNCACSGDLVLDFAKTSSIFLDGTSINRLTAIRADIAGSVYLRKGFSAADGIDLSGCTISGSLSCRGGSFRIAPTGKSAAKGFCLRIDDAKVGGAILLGPKNQAGEEADAVVLSGNVSFKGTKCDIFLDARSTYRGLADGDARLTLDGFTYDRLAGVSPADSDSRLRWLRLQPAHDLFEDFRPQPFEQLASVLTRMGHLDSARAVLIEQAKLQSRTTVRRLRNRNPFLGALYWLSACAMHLLSRYGFVPALALAWSLLPLVAGFFIFSLAYQAGTIAPTNAVVSRSDGWLACERLAIEAAAGQPLSDRMLDAVRISLLGGEPYLIDQCLAGELVSPGRALPGAPQYPRFSPFWYNLDTFVPIVSLHQEDYWIPTGRWPLPKYYLFWHILFGWLLVSLVVGGFLGTMNRRASGNR